MAQSGIIWLHGSWSTLVQLMAWCLIAPSHYLNKYWLFYKIIRNTSQCIFRWNALDAHQKYIFENCIFEITVTFSLKTLKQRLLSFLGFLAVYWCEIFICSLLNERFVFNMVWLCRMVSWTFVKIVKIVQVIACYLTATMLVYRQIPSHKFHRNFIQNSNIIIQENACHLENSCYVIQAPIC